MNYLKKFNEEVGFDDEEMRDRLEIANLRGELEPGSSSMKPYSKPLSDNPTTKDEIKKILYKFPILSEFHTVEQDLDGTELISFYATSKEPIDGEDYYCQISFATNDKNYFIGTIMRNREDYDNEEAWVKHSFDVDNADEAFVVTDAFMKVCKQLNIFDDNDMSHYTQLWN